MSLGANDVQPSLGEVPGLDMAKVLRRNAKVTLEMENFLEDDEYDDCLKTKEWTPVERGVVEHKYYCPGTGLVLINELTGGATVRVELVDEY